MENELNKSIREEKESVNETVQRQKPVKKHRLWGSLGVRLMVSLIAVAIAAAVRFSSPEMYYKTASCFSDSVDFISAFNAVSRGISGEQNMQEAMREACRYAFVGAQNESGFPASTVR